MKLDLFSGDYLPIGRWVEAALSWLVSNHREFFQALKQPVQVLLNAFDSTLLSAHPALIIFIFVMIGWQAGGLRAGVIAAFCLTTIGLIGAWANA